MDASRQLWGILWFLLVLRIQLNPLKMREVFLHVVVTIDQQIGIWVQ